MKNQVSDTNGKARPKGRHEEILDRDSQDAIQV